MQERWETLGSGDDAMRVFVGLPDGDGPHPGIVVAQNAGGVSEYIEQVVRDLVDAGYVAVAPDLYHRQHDTILEDVAKLPVGHPDRIPMTLSKAFKLTDDEVLADIDAASDLLRPLSEVRSDRLGIIGFCMGGRVAFLAPAQGRDFQAAAMYYGAGITMARGDNPAALAGARNIGCPLIGFFGDDDQQPAPADREAIAEELTKQGKAFEFHHYAGAGHAFMEEDNPTLPGVYRPEAAKDAWAKTLVFFSTHLG